MGNNEQKIGEGTKWFMLGVAILFDVLSAVTLIPVIGWILGGIVWAFAFGTFWLWFMMNGINIFGFSNPKRLFGSLLASIVELIPAVGVFPSWTVLVLWLTRVEEVVEKTVSKVPGASNVAKFVPKKYGGDVLKNSTKNSTRKAA